MNETKNQPVRRASLILAILGGLVGASIGAALWGAITFYTYFQISWMAVGVGFLTGMLVRILGRGTHPAFGVIGASFALLGCMLGNLLALYAMIAHEAGETLMNIATSMSASNAIQIFKTGFSYIDLAFYAIALYEGYRLSINDSAQPPTLEETDQAPRP